MPKKKDRCTITNKINVTSKCVGLSEELQLTPALCNEMADFSTFFIIEPRSLKFGRRIVYKIEIPYHFVLAKVSILGLEIGLTPKSIGTREFNSIP